MAELIAFLGMAAAEASAGAVAAGAAVAEGASSIGAGSLLSAGATLASGAAAYGQSQAGAKMARQQGEFNAKEAERAANEARSDAARKAAVRREEGERVLSRQRAVAAAGGAGGGEGLLDLMGDTAQRSEYYSDLELASGEQRAAGLEGRALVSRWAGDANANALEARGTGALLESGLKTTAIGLKARPGAFSSGDTGDLVSDSYDDYGWRTQTRRASGGRYY